ncbi:MAG: pyruvate dehydrogenase component, alpha subunit [Acidimicrobiaceae bacterium]|jgi:2-oxoisovalerate dehydrogenase E1 component alpha subunit|nr:pyruvate dehydrogenase component, alpha subunit [Acidimicrobiaceae bacterium]
MAITDRAEAPVAASTLQVLAPDGAVVPGARYPFELSDADHVGMLTAMTVTRRLDGEFVNLQRQGQLALYPSCLGQEAAQVGITSATRDNDWLFPQYRELGAFVVRGVDPAGIGHMWRGMAHGGTGLIEKCCAPITIPIGTHAPHAVGYALGAKFDGVDTVAVTFIGDGATSEGDVHEALNMAAVFQVPCIFVVQNNHWAISVPLSAQTRVTDIASKAAGYGMAGVRCDGNDVLACRVVMRDALLRAREGRGPTLIEAVTYRMGAHTTADDPTRYRSEGELELWRRRDPIDRYRSHLVAAGIWTAQHEERATETGERAAKRLRDEVFDAPMPDPLSVFDHVLSRRSGELERQRRQLARETGRDAT